MTVAVAGSQPEYGFYPTPADERGASVRRRTLSPDADEPSPIEPTDRLAALPGTTPPVFSRPVEPRGDQRPWSVPAQAGPPAPLPALEPDLPGLPAPRRPDDTDRPAAAERPEPTHNLASAPLARTDGGGRVTIPRTRPAVPNRDLSVGQRSRRRTTQLLALTTTLAAVVAGAGWGASVGVPRYLERVDRGIWERTTVALPRSAAGMRRDPSANATTRTRTDRAVLLTAGTEQMLTEAAAYTGPNGSAVVVVARPRRPLTPTERERVRLGYAAALSRASVVLSVRTAGPLGGWFGCGVRDGRSTTCLAVDPGSVVTISVPSTGAAAIDLARRTREAVVLRSPRTAPTAATSG